MDNIENKDEKLWKIARKRAAFKRHLFAYIVINALLWAIWAYQGYRHDYYSHIWPAWVTFGWGIGMIFDFFNSYFGMKENLEEREYRKLLNKQ